MGSRLRSAVVRGVCGLGLAIVPPAVAQPRPAAAQALSLAAEASKAAQAGDRDAALAKLEEAVALRADIPRLLVDLAAAQVAAEKPDDALATLGRLARLGLYAPVEKADEFAALRARKEFQEVVKQLAANLERKGGAEIAFTLRDVTGLLEGIAWREKTGEFYFGDVHSRGIWVRGKDGALRQLTAESDEVFGVFGLAIDEGNGALWAATTAVPVMRGFSQDLDGRAALVQFDLESGAVRAVIPPGDAAGPRHHFRHVAIAADGAVFVTDGLAAAVWRVAPGGSALELAVQSHEFVSLQGIALPGADAAIVSDAVAGLLRVDFAARTATPLAAPEDTTLIGIDGLAWHPDGFGLAIQSGVRPVRVLRVRFASAAEAIDGVQVLESGHPAMAAPSLGCIGPDGDFYYIGNPGWNRFAREDGQPSAPRPVAVFRTKLARK